MPGYNGAFVVLLSAASNWWLSQRCKGDALSSAASLCAANAALSLVLSWLTGDYSWVDRLWSVTPLFYALHFAAACGWASRPTGMAALVGLWGLRLSYNFARKAGYQVGEQDYRWPELQRLMRAFSPRWYPLLWHAFNLCFIAVYQHALLLLIVLPSAVAAASRQPLGALDAAAGALLLAFLLLETVADQQQWRFQQAKHGRWPRVAALKGAYAQGFLSHGLFAWSRHPNFFAEQAIWWSYYLFAVAALGGRTQEAWLNYSIVGPLLLSLLFQGSTAFTERITAAKYPQYAQYQRRVSRLLPLPPWLFAVHAS